MKAILPESVVILLVEDRTDDVELVRRGLLKAKVFNPLQVVSDGEEALAYLDGVGKYADRKLYPLPDIILLDLKMPKMDGFEVLREVRNRPALSPIRVLVLTSSEDIYEVNKAYALGANSFLVKPHDFHDFTALMRTLSAFWLQANRMTGIKGLGATGTESASGQVTASGS